MFEILITVAKIAPVIALMWLSLQYFLKKEKTYQSKIDELQTELRKNEKEQLQVMNRLTGVLDKLLENSAEDKHEILKEIASIHKDLTKKLNELKKA